MSDTIEISSSGLSRARTIASMPRTVRSVSSTRVPIGAFRSTRNCASSDGGKNSVPIRGRIPSHGAATRGMLATKVRAIEPTTSARWPSAHTISR